jgi:hypothetical protein
MKVPGFRRKLLCKREEECHKIKSKQWGVSHFDLAIYIFKKSILRQKKSYENPNISQCENIIFEKNPLEETNILQDIIKSITNFKFLHKPRYHLSKIPI